MLIDNYSHVVINKLCISIASNHGRGNGVVMSLLSGNSSTLTLLRGDPREKGVTESFTLE